MLEHTKEVGSDAWVDEIKQHDEVAEVGAVLLMDTYDPRAQRDESKSEQVR
jgi:hypothetical protein